jgi:hypothetical protein
MLTCDANHDQFDHINENNKSKKGFGSTNQAGKRLADPDCNRSGGGR